VPERRGTPTSIRYRVSDDREKIYGTPERTSVSSRIILSEDRRGTSVVSDIRFPGVIRAVLQTLRLSPSRTSSRVSLSLPFPLPVNVAYLKQVTCQRNGASLAAPGTTVRQVRLRAHWPAGVKPNADWRIARLRQHVGLISFTVGALAFSLSYLGRSVGRSVDPARLSLQSWKPGRNVGSSR